MSDSSDETTEADPTTTKGVEAVERHDASVPPAVEADSVRTVTRKGVALAMTGALVVGGLIGWVGAGTFGDDDASQLTSFQGRFPGGGGGRSPAGGAGDGFPGGGFHEHGPGAGRPGGGMPGGGYEGEDSRPTPPWMDDDEQGEQEPPPDEQDQDQRGDS
jgi:hypothetical protein